jgi:hypothetical protein
MKIDLALIKGREAKVLGVIFNCSVSAIQADVKLARGAAISSCPPKNTSG